MALPYALAWRLAAAAITGSQTGKTHPFLSNMGALDPTWGGRPGALYCGRVRIALF